MRWRGTAPAAARWYEFPTRSFSTIRSADPPPRPSAGGILIGIMGGTYDPVHSGHLAAARQLRGEAGLDQVLLIPDPHLARGGGAAQGGELYDLQSTGHQHCPIHTARARLQPGTDPARAPRHARHRRAPGPRPTEAWDADR